MFGCSWRFEFSHRFLQDLRKGTRKQAFRYGRGIILFGTIKKPTHTDRLFVILSAPGGT